MLVYKVYNIPEQRSVQLWQHHHQHQLVHQQLDLQDQALLVVLVLLSLLLAHLLSLHLLPVVFMCMLQQHQ
jgi:hypothetical protein